jgi:hypothetical protein
MLILIITILAFLVSNKVVPLCITLLLTIIIFECASNYVPKYNIEMRETPQYVGNSISETSPKEPPSKSIFWNMRNKDADYSQYSNSLESLKKSLMMDINNGKKQDPYKRSV